MSNQFFHSNIAMMPGNQSYLERPRLDRLLEQAVNNPLVIVTAGAGYGKTQAVYSFVRKCGVMTAWLQLSLQDNYPWRFWENFIQAAAFNDEDTLYKLAHTGFPETKRQFDRYIAIPRKVVDPGRKYLFVYDDFHLIQDKRVLKFIKQSVTTPFPSITSIFISRTEPALDLEGLEKQGLVSRITEEDLRFSQEEIRAYYDMQHISLGPGGLPDLYRDSEGWAFAIHLVGLSLKKGSAATDYGRSSLRSNIFPLIEREVFSTNSRKLQKFLITLSLIDHYPPELLAELAPNPAVIEELEQVNSFIRFDAYQNEYHIHHLFLEFLSAKQGELSAEEKKEVYTTAARWFAVHNMRMAAIGYFEKAGAYDELFRTLNDLPMVLQEHTARFLLDLMDRFPQETYRRHPTAWIVHVRLLLNLRRFDEAAAELQTVIREYEALPPSAFSDRLLSGCYHNLGFIYLITCISTHQYDFVPCFERAYEYFRRTPYEIAAPLRVAGIGSYVCRVGSPEQGKMEQYIEAIARTIPCMAATLNGCYYGMDDLSRAEMAYFRGNLEEAETWARTALAKSRERVQYEIENRSLFYLLRINLAWGEYGEVRELLKALEAQLKVTEYVNRQIYYDIITGWFYLQIRQAAKLAPWLTNDFEESELNSLLHGMESLVRIKWQVSEKRYPVALAALENPETQHGLGSFLLGKITMKVLEAVCLKEIGDRPGAMRALTEAYTLAEPNGLDMCFIEIGKDTRTLMETALREKDCAIPRPWLEKIRRLSSAHAKRLFEAAEHFRERRQTSPARGSGLSSREMTVLTGLALGLTREEIAEDSEISVNTVKSAIRSVYNKLGAVNRADAVRIAVSKGLLQNHE